MLMQKSYIPLNIGQSKTQESTLQASLFFKQQHSRETQLLCNPYIKLVLKLKYFDSHFLLLRAKVYNPAKAGSPSSLFLSPVDKTTVFEACEVSDPLNGRRVRVNRPHYVDILSYSIPKKNWRKQH